jgi:hypothetical protein
MTKQAQLPVGQAMLVPFHLPQMAEISYPVVPSDQRLGNQQHGQIFPATRQSECNIHPFPTRAGAGF